jgi:hypothetical protein
MTMTESHELIRNSEGSGVIGLVALVKGERDAVVIAQRRQRLSASGRRTTGSDC